MIDLLTIFDRDTGAKIRAALAAVLAVCTFVVAVAQAGLDLLDVLPAWDRIGAVAMILQGVISYVGRFTAFANKAVD